MSGASRCKLCDKVLRICFLSGRALCPCWKELIYTPGKDGPELGAAKGVEE